MVNAGLACLAHCCRMGGASACSFPIPFQPCLVRHRPVPYRTVPYRPYSHTAKQPHFSSLSSILLLSFDSSSSPSFLLSHLHRYPFHIPSPFASSYSLSLSHPFPFSSSLPLSRWPGPSAKPHIHRYYYYPPLSSWNNLASTNGLSGENRQQNPIEP